METGDTNTVTSRHRQVTDRPKATVSVRELVRRRMGVESDPWDLALVQRAEVWDQVRMRHLLDSLLAGYPIGAILLCRVAEGSRVIHVDGAEREVLKARAGAWQLLDGQQRINALFSILTDQGRYGRFYLNMTVRREPPGPTSQHRTKDRALSYIAWHDDSDPDAQKPQPREFHVDLSRWFDWAEAHPEGPSDLRVDTVPRILRTIDPDFTADLDKESADAAIDRLERLWRVWSEPSIPVLATEVQTPLDILEVFTRINLGGVQVAGTDVYLAAVKTFWPDAERSLDRVASASRFLDRMDALRFVSRLASRAIRQGDLLPLKVDRLAGRRGPPLIEAMSELTAEESRLNERVTAFSEVLRERSQLGYGLRLVSSGLWDEVLTWAALSEKPDEAWYAENLPLVDAYLLGASLFRYPLILGDRYRRGALLEAAAAGVSGEPFPLERILSVIRGSGAGLRGSRGAFIRSLDDEEDRQWIMDWNAGLLLSIAQRVPYQILTQDGDERRIDWDHIFPQAQAQRMWTISEYGRRKHHPYRRFVHSTGNLWALDASTNRALQDKPPVKKFRLLSDWQQTGTYPVWVRDQWSITDDEMQEFTEIDALLNDDPASIDAGMERFRALVTGRASWLLDHAIKCIPGTELFSADAPIDPSDPSAEPLAQLADSLGLHRPQPPQSDPASPTHEPLPFEWFGRDAEVEWVVKEATGRHTRLTDPSQRALPSGPGDGFDFRRYVPLKEPVPYILVGIVSRFARSGPTPVWLQVQHTRDGFATVRARINASPLLDRVRNDDGHIWLPLLITPELEWSDLADQLFERVLEIRQIIESPNV